MAETATVKGMKRTHSDSQLPLKRRRVHRRLQHVQQTPKDTELAPQDPIFVQAQLLRSITASLTMIGFDSVTPSALEMFRASVEEYMLTFLRNTRASMHSSRRTRSTPQDFASTLARTPNTRSASLLKPQFKLAVPESISYPTIPDPDPPPTPAPDFSGLLEPLVMQQQPRWIPTHFPRLPPQHAWKQTPVYPERERDARRMRERATEEGILAEQALRKLAAAAKSGAAKAERRRESTLSGVGRKVVVEKQTPKLDRRKQRPGEEDAEAMFGEMMREVEGGVDADEASAMDLELDGTNDLRVEGIDPGMSDGLVVNWQLDTYRRGGRKALRL